MPPRATPGPEEWKSRVVKPRQGPTQKIGTCFLGKGRGRQRKGPSCPGVDSIMLGSLMRAVLVRDRRSLLRLRAPPP